MSALTALAFGSVGAAGTFALFTDKAETTVNVQAGKVEVSSGVTIQKAYSLNALDATSATSTTHASYVNGGQADVSTETGNVQIQRWTPGDGLKLRTAPVNSSNVNILTRFKINLAGTLAPALEIRVRAAGAADTDDSNVLLGRIGAGQLVSDWVSVEYDATNPNHPAAYDIDIVFPDHDNGELKFGDENKDNEYMTDTATVVITYEAVQGNANVSANLLDRLNATLATESIKDGGANKTMHDAMADIPAALATEAAIEERGYVWNYETDQFYDFTSAPEDAYKYFKIADNAAAAGDYSIYASADWATASVPVEGKGFDAGESAGVTSVSYTGAAQARHNIIRTNSLATAVTVNAAADTVEHYGDAASVNIVAVANNSYHEYGNVAFTEIAKGRIVLEPTSEVKQIHIVASNPTPTVEEEAFEPIVIKDNGVAAGKLPSRITRDQVAVPANDEKLVVTVVSAQEVQEKVYVYHYVDTSSIATGTTEKISEGESKQNPNVATDLGMLVLDNGNDAGEKAMSENEKETAQKTAINAVITDAGYVARISTKYYTSFDAAFDDAKSNDELHVIRDCSATGHGQGNYYNASGMNLDIIVESGITLNCANIQNGKFVIGHNNAAGILTLRGEGKITFNAINQWGLITQEGSGNSIKAVVKDITIESDVAGGQIMTDGNLTIESGYFKNISISVGQVKTGFEAKLNEDTGYLEIVEAVPDGAFLKAIPNSDPSDYVYISKANRDLLYKDTRFKNGNYKLELIVDSYTYIADYGNAYECVVLNGDNIVFDFCGGVLSIYNDNSMLFGVDDHITNITFKNGTLRNITSYTKNLFTYHWVDASEIHTENFTFEGSIGFI